MAIPSLAGIMPATPAVPGIRFESGNPFLEGYAQTDRLMNQQAEEQRAKERAARLMWEFEQLREKAMTARAIDDAAREAFGAAGMPMPAAAPSGMPSPAAPGGAPVPMPEPGPPVGPGGSAGYTTTPVPDRTIDPSFDPVRYQERLIAMESGGNPTARNPRSSATGLGQFIDSTWLAVAPVVAQRLGQDLTGMPREQVLALRNDPEWSKAAIQVYAEQNRGALEPALGRRVGEGELRLAHGFGAQGAAGIIQGDPSTAADQHFPPNVMTANPHLRGKTLADIMRQYGITVPNAPGAVPSMIGRVPTPEQQAASDRMAATPAGQDAQNFDWRRETVAQPAGGIAGVAQQHGIALPNAQGAPAMTSPTGGAPQFAAASGTGIDGLFQRYTNPAMQDYRRRLAGIPGAGAELMKSHAGEWTARDEMGIKAFEAAAKGMPDAARYFAQQAGLRVDPRIFENRDMSAKAFEVLKSMAGQDPAYVAGVMKGVLQGQPLAQAWAAAGTPQPKPASEIGRLAADFGISPTSPEGQALGRRVIENKMGGGPFPGQSMDASVYNTLLAYNEKRRQGIPTTPQEDAAYSIAYQRASRPQRWTTPDGSMWEAPGIDVSAFTAPGNGAPATPPPPQQVIQGGSQPGLTGGAPPSGPGAAPLTGAGAQTMAPGARQLVGPGDKPATAEGAARVALVAEARDALAQAEREFFPGGRYDRTRATLAYSRVPGPGAETHNAMWRAVANRLRIESGAAQPDAEVAAMLTRYMPRPWDSEQTARQKIEGLKQYFGAFGSAMTTGPRAVIDAAPKAPAAAPSGAGLPAPDVIATLDRAGVDALAGRVGEMSNEQLLALHARRRQFLGIAPSGDGLTGQGGAP